MATPFENALARFIAACSFILVVHDLATKWRLELTGGHLLDLYFNPTLGKYSYTLVQSDRRILGWDNARHHPDLPNFPHHVHLPDGRIAASALTGDPAGDLEHVRREVEAFLAG